MSRQMILRSRVESEISLKGNADGVTLTYTHNPGGQMPPTITQISLSAEQARGLAKHLIELAERDANADRLQELEAQSASRKRA